jgi:hypothetical protein
VDTHSSRFKVQGSRFRVNLNISISEFLKPPEADEPLNPEPGTEYVQGYSESQNL